MKGTKKPTRAAGSQSMLTTDRGGQNKPDPGGKAGAGQALGRAPLAQLPKRPTSRRT